MSVAEAAKDEQRSGARGGLVTADVNKPTGAESRDLSGIGLMLGVSPAGGTGWLWWMLVGMAGGSGLSFEY